jgi:GTP-binding protein
MERPKQSVLVFCLQVTRIVKRQGGFGSQQLSHAHAGDIITITGISNPAIGDTICAPEVSEALQPGQIDPPTLSMVFAPNSSPVGRAPGNEVTAQKLLERLHAEALQSVSLRVRSALLKGQTRNK